MELFLQTQHPAKAPLGSLDSILDFASLFVKGTQKKNQDNRDADMLAQQKEIEQMKLEQARLLAQQQQAQRTNSNNPAGAPKDYTMWWIGGGVLVLATGGTIAYFATRKTKTA